ncbi:exo-beta-N-acetylmuramidase NamZ domain-containing protein [Ningiella sp. W23]|uniref:exo-beta-N-acetylmuramidase NamZ family protein n=1 Tax=Ningiella sp. W23 TaxID=3023715 RepID=UPI003757B3E9
MTVSASPRCRLSVSLLVKLLIIVVTLTLAGFTTAQGSEKDLAQRSHQIKVGAERIHLYIDALRDKTVGLVVNQSSIVNDEHLVDVLLGHDIDIRVLFAPEHGVRGDKGAGESIQSGVDAKTGVPIQSIYGVNKTPPDTVMSQLDIIVFDIQDVGTRFYTYISSMHYMMQAAAKHGAQFIVLDRPNPNGMHIDGPVLNSKFRSFVGMHPIPVLHGMTVGELALMIKGENWLELDDQQRLDLHVVPVEGYKKRMHYSLPIAPSPNLPNDVAVQLYPSLCFFEGTAVSVGRGTDYPFQQYGHHQVKLGKHSFVPEARPEAAPSPKLVEKTVFGVDMRNSTMEGLSLTPLIKAYELFRNAGLQRKFFTAPDFFDKLAGTDQLRINIMSGKTENEIRKGWQSQLETFEKFRTPYLLYAE